MIHRSGVLEIRSFFVASVLCFLSFLSVSPVVAAPSISEDEVRDIVTDLKYQTGTVQLDGDVATIRVPQGFKFLNAEQSKTVLTKIWGNPPDPATLGMLFLTEESPISRPFSYAVEISYSDDGYIKDDDAKDLNYDDLLKQMQKEASDSNEERKKEGYPTVELLGWAEPPHYDYNTKKLYWAKRLRFGDSKEETLNYNIRILGRKGVLVLNAIGDSNVLPRIKKDADAILASADFNQGFRYADYIPGADKVAAYGIGALIAGKVLAKAGFLALIVKFWKLGLLALAPLFAFARKFFSKKD